MSEKQKPFPEVVHIAARVLQNPASATQEDARRMAARILDDQRNDPKQHKPSNR
jgi:hypothetical protein